MSNSIFGLVALLWLASSSAALSQINPDKLVLSARKQIGVTRSYDPAYRELAYPGGDVPRNTGVCTDVIIRALREQSVDLQKAVHEDMERDFKAYPRKWQLTKPDANIDHRRVPNLMTYFQHRGWVQAGSDKPGHFAPGDVVAWDLGQGTTHIGIVSDRRTSTGVPLVIHNIGHGTQEEDALFQFKVIGHYRLK